MNDTKCPFMGPGKRCKGGYHLRGTVAATPISDAIPTPQTEVLSPGVEPKTTQDPSSQPQPQLNQLGGNVIIDPMNFKDFLGKLIREEMAGAMTKQPARTLLQQPQPIQPQPPPQQPQQQLQGQVQ